jgi:hypothetical protein
MINENLIQTGDSFFVRDKSDFVSRTICGVMKDWSVKNGYSKLPNFDPSLIFSHAARFTWIAGKLYLCGSIDSGYRPILFSKHYDFEKSSYVIMRRNTMLSDEEKDQTVNYCLHLTTVSKVYQYWNFIQWPLLVYLGIDTFGNEGDGVTYCYESERMARKNLNPEKYGSVFRTDLFQLLYDPTYSIIYKNLVDI